MLIIQHKELGNIKSTNLLEVQHVSVLFNAENKIHFTSILVEQPQL